ncbi:GNAT family N-acetyltransferase [Mucilaginibacter myungsuensis]|uniref:GNAT family N-acetyltransferase n=1 Tax=Mucilaginibacter myungsuensis TaxID=649104 RepID=A0A929KXV0_9SPHI|nr:GNAT family N-acetyltransferase [Mucilaginibacter myungsuensis]MBE9662515.1 GNAT family N-acetyltransferase [Mucilaginibacter myungsuensis]MDN3597934.1 GNAT family N-acetyltransferase [Mucilaginibacter myungsuensis]
MAADINNFPTLFTERLVLRKLNASDVGQLAKLRSDENVNQYLGRPSTCTNEDAEAFISKINGFVDAGQSYYWTITLKDIDDLIGTICYYNISPDKTQAELGYELLPEYQGKGIMREAIKKVISFGKTDLDFNIITALPTPDNGPSVKLLERVGFKLDETSQYVSKEESGEQVVYVLLS